MRSSASSSAGQTGAGEWSTLLDLDVEAAAVGSTYGEVGVREISPDGSLLAWSFDSTGEELYELRFRDVSSGADLPERVERTYYGGAWAADGRTFFYTVVDHVYRPHQVWRHVVGTDPAADVLVLQEDDRRFELSVRTTRCGQWVLIHAASRDSAETWAIPAAEPTAAPATVGGRREGHEYCGGVRARRSGALPCRDQPRGRAGVHAQLGGPGRDRSRDLAIGHRRAAPGRSRGR